MNKWQDPSLSLGERCVAFAENEMANGVAEDKPNSFTSPRLRQYFKICTRLVNGKEVPIGLTFTAGNWCSAGVSFCLQECLLPGENPLHGYRLGVVEVIADMQRAGTYRSVDKVRTGVYKIKVGDPVFFDRSSPNNPASTWWRHIGRVQSVGSNGNFVCISGNNGGKWRLSNHNIKQGTLLGFGEYPSSNGVVSVKDKLNSFVDLSALDILALAPLEDTGKNISSDIIDLFDDAFDEYKGADHD